MARAFSRFVSCLTKPVFILDRSKGHTGGVTGFCCCCCFFWCQHRAVTVKHKYRFEGHRRLLRLLLLVSVLFIGQSRSHTHTHRVLDRPKSHRTPRPLLVLVSVLFFGQSPSHVVLYRTKGHRTRRFHRLRKSCLQAHTVLYWSKGHRTPRPLLCASHVPTAVTVTHGSLPVQGSQNTAAVTLCQSCF